jgi:hypothetical protein
MVSHVYACSKARYIICDYCAETNTRTYTHVYSLAQFRYLKPRGEKNAGTYVCARV